MVLPTLVDMDSKFIWFDIVTPGSSLDSQIIEDNTIGFPQEESLLDHSPQAEFFLIGHDRSMHLNECMFN